MFNKYKDLLSVGQVFKNYKDLCETIGEPVKEGSSKRAQLKEWNRFFEYDKQGYKFIITDIYDEPKEKIDDKVIGNGEGRTKKAAEQEAAKQAIERM